MCVRVCVPEIMLNCMSCEALPASNCWCVYKRVSVCVRACACACVCKCSLSIRSVEHASMDLCRRILLAQAFCQTSCRQLGGSCALLPVLVVGARSVPCPFASKMHTKPMTPALHFAAARMRRRVRANARTPERARVFRIGGVALRARRAARPER